MAKYLTNYVAIWSHCWQAEIESLLWTEDAATRPDADDINKFQFSKTS